MNASPHRRTLPEAPSRRGWCPGLARPMPTGDGLLARVHPPLGVLSLAQARAVAQGARLFGNGHLDLTARANLQIRGVTGASSAPLARLLTEASLGDRRADGGPQRLTLTQPLAGHDPAELFDVPALARAIETAAVDIVGLPAKTLVVVEGRRNVAAPDADCLVAARDATQVEVAIAAADGMHTITDCTTTEAPAIVTALLGAFARTGRRRMRDLSEDERATLAEALVSATHGQDRQSRFTSRLPSPLCGLPNSHIVCDAGAAGRTAGPLSRAGEGQGEGSGLSGQSAPVRRVDGALNPEGSGPSPQPSPARERGHVALCREPRCPTQICEYRSLCGGEWPDGRTLRQQGSGEGSDGAGMRTDLHEGYAPSGSRAPLSPPASQGTLPRRGGRETRAVPFAPSAGLRESGTVHILALDAPFGRCTADALDRVVSAAEAIGADAIRLSPTRGFVLLAPGDAPAAAALADLAADFIVAPQDPRRSVDACTGAPGCASGSTSTLADAAHIAKVFRPLAAQGFTAHVSGCAKGCARPGPADLTLVGAQGRYGIVVGGAPGDEPAIHLPIEAVLDRLGRAKTVGLAAAFMPNRARPDDGRDGRPA